MRLRAFDLNEPLPVLNKPHALAVIQPWMDVSRVGSLILSCLETFLGPKELGKLERPGDFFDFIRYRPTINRKENRSEVVVPNTVITYGKQPSSHDFVFLRLLEPQMKAEEYIDRMVVGSLFQSNG